MLRQRGKQAHWGNTWDNALGAGAVNWVGRVQRCSWPFLISQMSLVFQNKTSLLDSARISNNSYVRALVSRGDISLDETKGSAISNSISNASPLPGPGIGIRQIHKKPSSLFNTQNLSISSSDRSSEREAARLQMFHKLLNSQNTDLISQVLPRTFQNCCPRKFRIHSAAPLNHQQGFPFICLKARLVPLLVPGRASPFVSPSTWDREQRSGWMDPDESFSLRLRVIRSAAFVRRHG
ncbi:hypothetical protein AVEN_13301-1 [Araneus ventricosus]|uniref:Uncharacterized protein n=1 Tax=Araneus ventricosus TaxID=182803 RepID=A0A4Y2UG48_ARAVE|nr:hypothetical protein AVEN_13301-1 [Araneus ventricosus]